MNKKDITVLVLLIAIFGTFIATYLYLNKNSANVLKSSEEEKLTLYGRIQNLSSEISQLKSKIVFLEKIQNLQSETNQQNNSNSSNSSSSTTDWLPNATSTVKDVLFGKTFYSLGEKILKTGTMLNRQGTIASSNQETSIDGITLTPPDGYYDGESKVSATNEQIAALSPDLVSGNILSGSTIFGVAGNIPIKEGDNASTAQATAGGIVYLTAPTGYYDGDDRVSATNAQMAALSVDLVSGNILSGSTIFGVAGSIPLKTGDNASTAQATAGGIVYLTAPTGYYDGDDRVSATNAQIVALDPNLISTNIITGVSIFGVTGTYPNPTSCATEEYHDSYGVPVTEETNCSLTWTAPASSVEGDDNRAGRGGKDPRTGLIWSQCLKNVAGVVTFTGTESDCSAWSWDATSANNVAVGGKTSTQLCSERGNGWRLPSQKELMGAYMDGSYWNLTNSTFPYWAITKTTAANSWYVYFSYGTTNNTNKANPYYTRCVR